MFGRSVGAKRVIISALMMAALLSGCGSDAPAPDRQGASSAGQAAEAAELSGDSEPEASEPSADHASEAENTGNIPEPAGAGNTSEAEAADKTGDENSDASKQETQAAAAENESGSQSPAKADFELTDKGKAFLARMCRELGDFDARTTMDEKFWRDFLFYSYTGASPENAEMEQIYREDLGFEETVVKVSLQEAEAHAKLVFGIELPDVKPAFEDMEERQTSCYYQDGYYYIGVSDFPAYEYTFAEFTADGETAPYAVVKFDVDFEGESKVGTVSFTITPKENENGFVILSKNMEIFR